MDEELNKLFEHIDNLLGSEDILDHPISIDVIKEWFNEYETIKTKWKNTAPIVDVTL